MSEKNGQKSPSDSKSDSKKNVSDGSSPISDSASKGKAGSISDKAVVILKKKASASTDKVSNTEFFQKLETIGSGDLLVEVDRIYHLACLASPIFYKYNPVKTIKTNVIGTLNMLGLAKRVGARILLTSTSEVYGDPLEHPQNENYWGNVNPIGKF